MSAYTKVIIDKRLVVKDKNYFETRIERIPWSGCWIWLKHTDKDGYGIVQVNGAGVRAHRLSCEIWGKPIPKELFGCHTCDVTSCVNPDHVFPGTVLENTRDAKQKGRMRFGHKHAGAKINEEEALFIKNSGDSIKSLSEKFGIGRSQIYRIRRGEKWSHIS